MNMFSRINVSAPDLVIVCFDRKNELEGMGRLYDYYGSEAKNFKNEYHLLYLMENLMENLNYPQTSTIMRNYREKEAAGGAARKKRPEKVVGYEELLNHRGEIATFAVYIQYRQNTTWQGSIYWIEQDQTRSFRSALEMLKLIDNAVMEEDRWTEGISEKSE